MSNTIKTIITEHPVGPHRRLYLLLRWRHTQQAREAAATKKAGRRCACGARVTNQNPKVTKCNHCYSAEKSDGRERSHMAQLRDLEHGQPYSGHRRNRITMDDYER